jgi:cell fate regulator YaaT (PSP1 superfamily)
VPQMVEVRFKGNRKAYFEWHEAEPLRPSEAVVVESERGLDLGHVSATDGLAQKKCDRCRGCGSSEERGSGESITRRQPEPTRRVVRRALAGERRTAEELRGTEDDVRRKVREKVTTHGLPMKVCDAEWQWDRNKLTIYFTAEKRVDFRALVRELATQFRARIELRQIGVRDEAARLGGIGRCGRELCSATWLPELRPIGLHIAKDQRLSLNPSQISGPCGRLLCCLRFEHEFYVQSRKRFPKEGKVLQTSKGAEKVYSIDIFRDRVTLRAEDGSTRIVPLADLKKEVDEALARGAVAAAVGGPSVPAAAEPGVPPGAGARTPRGGERRPREERPERHARLEQVPPARGTQAPPAVPASPASPAPVEGAALAPVEGAAPGPDGPRRKRRRRRRRRGNRGTDGHTPPGGPAADATPEGEADAGEGGDDTAEGPGAP